jgi:hypothetical protein
MDNDLAKGPDRATTLPTNSAERKTYPIASGVLDYFPDALVAIAQVSYQGNQQHNPGKPLHWDRTKSQDHSDTAMRHFVERGKRDSDGQRHTAKFAWRALAMLQKEIEDDATVERALATSESNARILTMTRCGWCRNFHEPHCTIKLL